MKARFSLCMGLWLLVLLVLNGCDTASNVEDPDRHYFIKYYGGEGNQYGVDMLALEDGSFLLLGNYAADGDVYTDIYLVRVDNEGEVMWEKTLGGEDDILNAIDLEITSDGNFVVLAGFQASFGAQTDLQLYKISPDGTLLESVPPFGKPAHDFGKSVTLLDDGGFIVSGYTQFTAQWKSLADPGLDPGDTFAYRFDQNLQQFSETDWGPVNHGFGSLEGSQLDVAVKTIEIPDPTNVNDRNYYVFGYTNSNLNNNNPKGRLGLFYFLRGPSGTEDKNYYPGNVTNVNDTEINFVDQLPVEMGSGFIVVGTSRSNLGVSEIFIARLQNSLTFSPPRENDAPLYKTIPLNRNIRGVSAVSSLTGQFGYLVLGNEVRSTGKLNLWLSKVSQKGEVLWSTTIGSEARDDFGAAVTQLSDGRIFVLGTMGLADNQFKMALIKINSQGQFLK